MSNKLSGNDVTTTYYGTCFIDELALDFPRLFVLELFSPRNFTLDVGRQVLNGMHCIAYYTILTPNGQRHIVQIQMVK